MSVFKKIEKELKADAPALSEKISRGVDWDKIAEQNGKGKLSKNGRLRLGFGMTAAAVAIAIVVSLFVYSSVRKTTFPSPVAVYDIVIETTSLRLRKGLTKTASCSYTTKITSVQKRTRQPAP